MSGLQHERIAALCEELKLASLAEQYSPVAQTCAQKESSFADFLEDLLRAEREARRARCWRVQLAFPPSKRWTTMISASPLARRRR